MLSQQMSEQESDFRDVIRILEGHRVGSTRQRYLAVAQVAGLPDGGGDQFASGTDVENSRRDAQADLVGIADAVYP